MEDIFDPATGEHFRRRIESVTAEGPRQWGTMSAAQMLEHCARGVEMVTGDAKLPRIFVGRILGPIIKLMMLKEGAPFRRNSPTAPALVVRDEVEVNSARTRLLAVYDCFLSNGPAGCTDHPHPFFGRLTPNQWSALMCKHLDHHLRQFNA